MSNKYFHIENFLDPNYSTLFVLGARGVGKTISALSYYIKTCYNEDTKFIYLRRYQSEIDTLGFDFNLLSSITKLDVSEESVKDDSGRKLKMITANDKPVGYLLALSVASKYKSNSYKGVKTIIYDEFIDIRNRELKNETNLYLNFCMTVFRKFENYQSVFLANSTNLFNCYFVNFNTYPRGKITRYKNLSIKIVMYKTSVELNKREKTPLARLVRKSGDGDSSLDNNFKESTGFIQKLPQKTSCILRLKFNSNVYGLWAGLAGDLILSSKFDPSTKIIYSVDGIDENVPYVPTFMIRLAELLKNNHLFFDQELTRGLWLKFLKERRMI